ncbi:hypothetical protein [Massilibacteroides sp.]|uniref:hypothetical protein n=1 Tax=Massilibacteroides sp. TaxID=2034766 RepID=UPI0026148404|nr:hypothetical protein [Massilibacteroides sp.]MDD4515471.1 hypothetical protein [Massilibacteroides sp.]
MKKYIYILGIGVASFSLTNCSDSVLNESPNGYISPEQLEKNAVWNPNILLGQSAGIVATTFSMGSGGSTTDHDDFGQKSVDLVTDIMVRDIAVAAANYD